MKTSSKIIIYDDGCPLCAAYTAGFVASGMLTAQGRRNFSNVDAVTFGLVDQARCNNEIPLVDTDTQQVWYGIDALLELLNQKIPFIKFIGNIKPAKWFLQRTYKFISYNRKVIVGAAPKIGYDCSPDFNIPYRVYFLVFFFLFNTLMLIPLYQSVFSKSFIGGSSFAQLQSSHFVIVTVNITIAIILGGKKGLEYLGQVNMLALTCILLIVPMHFLTQFVNILDEAIHNFYLGLVALVVIREYFRRMKYAQVLKEHVWIVAVNMISLAAFFAYLINSKS